MPSDLEIAQSAKLLPVAEVAEKLGLREDELDLYGRDKAKVRLSVLERLSDQPDGRYRRAESDGLPHLAGSGCE